MCALRYFNGIATLCASHYRIRRFKRRPQRACGCRRYSEINKQKRRADHRKRRSRRRSHSPFCTLSPSASGDGGDGGDFLASLNSAAGRRFCRQVCAFAKRRTFVCSLARSRARARENEARCFCRRRQSKQGTHARSRVQCRATKVSERARATTTMTRAS